MKKRSAAPGPSSKQQYGVAAGILSAASYGGMSLAVHASGVKLPATEVIFFRSVFALLAFGAFASRDRKALLSRKANALWLRSFCGAVSILCFTWNLQHTSIGFANVLFGVAPLGVLLFTWMSRSERLTPPKILCLGLVVAGSLVFYGGAFGSGGLVLGVGLLGAAAAALSYTTLKRASSWSPLTLTWSISLASVPMTLLMKRGPWPPLQSNILLPLLAIAVLCSLGQIFVALSYRWAEISAATALVQGTMAFGVLFDVLHGTSAGGRQLFACGIYLAGCIPLVMQAQNKPKQEFTIVIETAGRQAAATLPNGEV